MVFSAAESKKYTDALAALAAKITDTVRFLQVLSEKKAAVLLPPTTLSIAVMEAGKSAPELPAMPAPGSAVDAPHSSALTYTEALGASIDF